MKLRLIAAPTVAIEGIDFVHYGEDIYVQFSELETPSGKTIERTPALDIKVLAALNQKFAGKFQVVEITSDSESYCQAKITGITVEELKNLGYSVSDES